MKTHILFKIDNVPTDVLGYPPLSHPKGSSQQSSLINPNFISGLLVLLTGLIGIAFVTVTERKTMGSMQRRLGPNIVGVYVTLQPFADALKLILKEYLFRLSEIEKKFS